jgi:SAM-dependent methyltransferase
MHEWQFERVWSTLLGGLTEVELDAVARASRRVAEFCEQRFQHKVLARTSLLRSLHVLRQLTYLWGDAPLRIFEVGPGSGYLGALAVLEGHAYAATDVAQAFYLYQHALWSWLTDGRVVELAATGSENPYEALGAIQGGTAVHVPWWVFAMLQPEQLPSFDVVVCNHALCEMHPNSLRCSLKIAHALLRRPTSREAAFVFEGWGQRHQSTAAVTESFYRAGFVLAHHDEQITVFMPRESPRADGALRLPVARRGIGARNWLRRVLDEKPLGRWSYDPPGRYVGSTPLSRTLCARRGASQRLQMVGLDRLRALYTEVIGHADHLSPDERFLGRIREERHAPRREGRVP